MSVTSPDLDMIACDWIARRDRGLSPEESAQLLAWLATEAHARAFAAQERTWKIMARAQAVVPPARLEAMLAPRRSRRRVAPLLWFGFAAAAAVALLLLNPPPDFSPRPATVVTTYAAPAGAEARVALPDGTIAVLHRGSRLVFGEFAAGRRVRLLEGEAHFTVSKTSAAPFYVHAGSVLVRDIGTAFNVRLEPERVAVLVTEGRVEVHSEAAAASPDARTRAAPLLLSLGQEAVVVTTAAAPLPERREPSPQEVEQALAWKSRRIKFDRTPLTTAIGELNRYNVRQLVIADSSLGAVEIGGGVKSDDLDAFVGLLESGFGITAEIRDNEIVLRKSR